MTLDLVHQQSPPVLISALAVATRELQSCATISQLQCNMMQNKGHAALPGNRAETGNSHPQIGPCVSITRY
jgi:hypothetical protein